MRFPRIFELLINFLYEHQYDFKLLQAVIEVNAHQRVLMIQKIKAALGPLTNRTLGILGLAYKPNTDDIRESPAIDLIRLLQSEGAYLRAYDPVAMEGAKLMLERVDSAEIPTRLPKAPMQSFWLRNGMSSAIWTLSYSNRGSSNLYL